MLAFSISRFSCSHLARTWPASGGMLASNFSVRDCRQLTTTVVTLRNETVHDVAGFRKTLQVCLCAGGPSLILLETTWLGRKLEAQDVLLVWLALEVDNRVSEGDLLLFGDEVGFHLQLTERALQVGQSQMRKCLGIDEHGRLDVVEVLDPVRFRQHFPSCIARHLRGDIVKCKQTVARAIDCDMTYVMSVLNQGKQRWKPLTFFTAGLANGRWLARALGGTMTRLLAQAAGTDELTLHARVLTFALVVTHLSTVVAFASVRLLVRAVTGKMTVSATAVEKVSQSVVHSQGMHVVWRRLTPDIHHQGVHHHSRAWTRSRD